jgi:hypothetical protein
MGTKSALTPSSLEDQLQAHIASASTSPESNETSTTSIKDTDLSQQQARTSSFDSKGIDFKLFN